MAITLIAHTTIAVANGGLGGTSAAIDTTGASLLVFTAACLYNNPPFKADNKSNTWITAVGKNGTFNNTCSYMFFAWNPIVGTGHTFTSSALTYPASQILAFSGIDATSNPLDQINSATNTSTLTIQPGSITPSQAGSLIITDLCLNYTAPTPTIDSGMTEIDYINFNSGNYFGGDAAYFVQGAAAAFNPIWTTVSGSPLELTTTIMNFRPATTTAGFSKGYVFG